MSAYAAKTIPGEWSCYKVLTFVADVLEDMFYEPAPRYERSPNEAAHWSKEEFLAKFDHSVPLEGSEAPFGGYLLFALDEHTVVKPKPLWDSDAELEREMQAWRYVWKHTTIPTPRYHQILTIDGDPCNGYIVMDYIEGERLDHAWPKLSIWSRFRVAWTLRSYVRQLRRAPVPPSAFPGPLGPFPRPCEGGAISYITPVQWMEPCPSAKALYDHIQEVAEGRCKTYRSQPALEKPKPFVFTHNDLNLRNVILGKDGLIYLIDWDFSGFYPPWFEYVSMTWSAAPVHRPPCPDWAWYCGFIADPYFAYYRWLGGYPS